MPRHKRKNADDRLRRLERQAASGDPADVTAYWRAAIAAGELPKPTAEDSMGVVWFLGAPVVEGSNFVGTREGMVYANKGENSVYISISYNSATHRGIPGKAVPHTDHEGIKDAVIQRLQIVIDNYDKGNLPKANPRRKNADDALRKAERAFKTAPSLSRQIDYWRACIRAGITPEPSRIEQGASWWILNDARLPERPVVALFDDGYINYAFGTFVREKPTVNAALELAIEEYLQRIEKEGLSADYWFWGPYA